MPFLYVYVCDLLEKLGEVAEWVAQYRQHWEGRLDNLETYLEKLKKERYGKQKK